MEFNEKLQQLRKQNDMTQEQLAECLYVSRTAISKWENGKGYPNIESLKSISKLFSVSIDELLSGEELITLAVNENRSNIHKILSLINAALDVAVIAFIFLPLYGKSDGTYIHSVNLFSFTDTTPINFAIYWAVFTIIIVLGIAQFIFSYIEKEKWQGLSAKFSFIIEAFSICFFAAAKEPYVTALLFIQFLIKVLILKKSAQMK